MAVFILRLVRSDLTFLSVDPNVTTIIEGTIMVVVVMLGALRRDAGPLRMSQAAQAAATAPLGRRIRRFMSDRPIVPLIVLLVALVVVLEILRPGIVNERWIANTIKFAIPARHPRRPARR